MQTSATSDDQVIPGQRVNSAELDRQTRKGQAPIRWGDFSGGLTRISGIGNVRGNNLIQYAYNQGLVTRIPGYLGLPFNPTVQASISSEANISAFIAANKRLHSINAANGDTALRWLAGLGTKLYGDTSSTDPTLLVRTTLTDSIISTANLRFNSTNYLAYSARGTTDHTGGTVDVSGSGAPSFTTLVTHLASGDGFWAMQYYPDLHCNILIGQYNSVNGIWYVSDTTAIPAVPQPVVFTDTKDVEGVIPTVTTSTFLPTSVWQETPEGGGTFDYQYGWSGLTNLGASDNTYATFATQAFFNFYSYPLRVGFGGQFSTMSPSALIKGYTIAIEGHEDNANRDIFYHQVRLTVDGQPVGDNRANPDNFELNATTDTTTTFGSSTDAFGISLTGANLQNIGVRIVFINLNNNVGTASIDTVTIAVTSRMPGTQATVNQGGWAVAPHPLFPDRLAYVEPAADDPTAITQPRRLCFLDFSYDNAGQRPTVAKTYANVGNIPYVHHAAPFLGSYLITGSASAGPGDRVVLVKSDNTTQDYQFPGFMGSTIFKVNALFSSGIYAIAQVVASDFSDMQYWLFNTVNNSWYTDTVLQSKTGTSIALQPIPYAETTLGIQQSQIYTIYPRTTHTAARREFMPSDLNQDPRTTNTTQTKYASALFLQTMEMEAGYPDASATIVQLDYQERMISASGGNFGTVQVQIEVGGDATFASPAIDTTFSSGHNATIASRGSYPVPGSGVAFQTQIARFTLDQGSGTTTAGPNGLNVLETYVPEWAQDLRVYKFQLAPSGHSKPDILSLLEEFERVKTKKNVQPLKTGSVNVNASYNGVVGDWQVWTGGRGATESSGDQIKTPVIQFTEKMGSV